MKTYHKIETVYERDEATGKLKTGVFRNATVEYLKDCVWQFTEKVDGTNIRVYWDGYKVSFGGRTDKAKIPKHRQQSVVSEQEAYMEGLVARPKTEICDRLGNRIIVKIKHRDFKED